MRTERLLACVAALGLLASFSYAVQADVGDRVDAKAQSGKSRSAGDQKKASVSGGGASVEAMKSSEGSVSVTIAGNALDKGSAMGEASAEDVVRISGKDHHQTHECKGRSFVIVGNSNTIKLTGECKTLNVAGKYNQVDVEAVAAIRLSGNENKVTWERGVNNKPPSIEQAGKNNVVSRKGN